MKTWVVLIVTFVIALTLVGVYLFIRHKKKKPHPSPPTPKPPRPPQPHTPESELLISYFKALYPNVPQSGWDALKDDELEELYDSLYWYYLPLVQQIRSDKRLPLQSPTKNEWTQAFLSDGTDCGQWGSDGTFFCSVFGGCPDGGEFSDYAQPYQAIQFIKPYGRRDGFPNDCYVEPVAFVCEDLGRSLYTAPDCTGYLPKPTCGTTHETLPMLSEATSTDCSKVTPTCPPDSTCNRCSKGCTYNSGSSDMSDTCCYDWNTKQPDDSVCSWPEICMAQPPKPGDSDDSPYSNYCDVPCGYLCGTQSCDWYYDGKTEWLDWLKYLSYSYDWVNDLKYNVKPSSSAVPNKSKAYFNKTMFYWQPGYGKFLNMGKTGIYFQYVHFMLTCPKVDTQGNPLRWTFPQIVQASTMGSSGNAELGYQLNDLTNGKMKDERYYLEGFVTTLKGSSYEGIGGGEEVDNDLLYGDECGNVDGKINPLDDDFLKFVDSLVVTKYYDPAQKIKNPQYGKYIRFTPAQAVALVAGAHIYGATGADAYGYMKGSVPSKYESGWGTYPHGTFFSGSNLGSCVYDMVYALGWDSLQLTMMPTGAGRTSYCTYPWYDFELVYVSEMDRTDLCKKGFKLLDITSDLRAYVDGGYVRVSKAKNVTPFDAGKMALSERNVPYTCGSFRPNAQHYNQPSPAVKDTTNCPYYDDVYRYAHDHSS